VKRLALLVLLGPTACYGDSGSGSRTLEQARVA
jgi:hypothetical protein